MHFLCTFLLVFVKVTTDEQDEAKALHEKRLEEEVRFTSFALVIHDIQYTHVYIYIVYIVFFHSGKIWKAVESVEPFEAMRKADEQSTCTNSV